MSDGLDDLFSAFDAGSSSSPRSAGANKAAKVGRKRGRPEGDDEGTNSNPSGQRQSEERQVMQDAADLLQGRREVRKGRETMRAAADGDGEVDADGKKGGEGGGGQQQAMGDVATGTAHDKSIKSFTAMPSVAGGSSGTGTGTGTGTNSNGNDGPISSPAKTYPFKLDPFQEEAIGYIERGESVLVAAHTSAGKTAVAEYAVAKALKGKSRVVYTSPIKALSNQKYRDLQEEFGDVGLMTGDITINPSATCLVMTTEILRSMLYKGSELMREVSWVIYDEVHYMRDKERGVVWEESIILLPHKVRFVFLSATIPNSRQFVGWIAKIHNQPCHVVYTNYRPVPLQQYIFPNGGEGLYLVVDEKGNFREDNFQNAMSSLSVDSQVAANMLTSGNAKGGGKKGKGGGKEKQKSDLHRIVQLVMERSLNPVIIFSFSKKECEKYALELNREDYNVQDEKDLVEQGE